mgnify:CR=1 FL=1
MYYLYDTLIQLQSGGLLQQKHLEYKLQGTDGRRLADGRHARKLQIATKTKK